MVGSAGVVRPPEAWFKRWRRIVFLSDAFVLALVMTTAQALRFGWDPTQPVHGPSAPPYWFVSVAIGLLWLFTLAATRSREPRIMGHGATEFQRVFTASWYAFAAVAIVGFLTQWQISRGYLLFAFPAGVVLLLLYRALLRRLLHAKRARGDLMYPIVVAGPQRTVEQMVERLQGSSRAGYAVVGVCVPDAKAGESLGAVPVLGSLPEVIASASKVGASYVVVAGNDAMSLAESRKLGWELEGTGIGLIVVPSMLDVAGKRVLASPVRGIPLMHVDAPEFSGPKYWIKSFFDKVASFLALVIHAIPMLIIALAIKLTSRGPVLFKQERVGRDHRPFYMLKFRSMYVDAEERLAELQAASDGNGVLFKMKNDPRVTPIGRFLRRFSLDELPQIINVLRGDMSLVGPRPPLPAEVAKWDDRVGRRQLVKPGITGLWQVSGRSDLSWEESVRLDLYYTENWSFASDILIIIRTLQAVLSRRGAY